MKRTVSILLFLFLLLTGCGGNTADGTYRQISQEEPLPFQRRLMQTHSK